MTSGQQWALQAVVLVILAVVARSYFTATAEARMLDERLTASRDTTAMLIDSLAAERDVSDALIEAQDRNEEVTDSIINEAEGAVEEATEGTDEALAAARNAAADLPIVTAALDRVTEELAEERTANEIFRATSAAEIFAGQQRERTLGMQLINERSATDLVIDGLRGDLSISMDESDAWERASKPGALTQIWRQGRAAIVAVILVTVISN
jgi:hypothetical protein